MTHSLTLALVLAAAYIRGQMEYRFNFVVSVIMGLVYQLTGFVFVWVLIVRFSDLGGWTLGEIAFLYGLRLLVHALRGICFGNVGREMEWLVRFGEFDRIVVVDEPPTELHSVGEPVVAEQCEFLRFPARRDLDRRR